jgi:hypothetical protein
VCGAAVFVFGCGAKTTSSPNTVNDELETLKVRISAAESEALSLSVLEDTAKRNLDVLQQKIEETNAALLEQERLLEQDRLRTYLVSVIDETKRKAAAEEEYRVRFTGLKTTAVRAEVEGFIAQRTRALMEVVAIFVDKGLIDAADHSSLLEKEKTVARAQSSSDLAALQYNAEELLSFAHRYIDEAWTASGERGDEAAGRTAEALNTRGISNIRDELGFWVTGDEIEAAASLLKEISTLSLIVFSYSPKAQTDEISLKQSNLQAVSVKEQLEGRGVAVERIRSHGCGRFAPSAVMSRRSLTALLIVPIPPKK